jgi:hypothetical protein
MVNWLWKQYQEEKIGIRYTIIFHKLIWGHKFHKHPKGCHPKDIISLSKVTSNMQVQFSQTEDVIDGVMGVKPTEPTDYLESLQFDGNSLNENCVKTRKGCSI